MLIQENDTTIEENNKLKELLEDVKSLSLVQGDINHLLNTQEENLIFADSKLETSLENLEKANIELKKASKYKPIIKPIIIGGSIGVLCSLPISIPICLSTSLGTSLIAYSCIGGGIIGGISGKILS